MGHQCLADITRDPESRQMGTHQATDIDQDGQHGEQHRHPAVVDHMGGLGVVGSNFENLPNHEKEKHKGKKGQNRADGGQQQR